MANPKFFIDIAESNGDFFTDASINDIIMGPLYPTQKILLGTRSNEESILRLSSNDVHISANFIPSACNLYSLGSKAFLWKDLYLAGQTIYLGDTKITIDNDRGDVEIRQITDNSLKRLVVDEIQIGSGNQGNVQRIANRDGQISFTNHDSNTGVEKATTEIRARTLIADSNVYLGTGSVPFPSFAFTNSSNTGFYSPSANAIGFVTHGVERMAIGSTGNIALKGVVTLSSAITGCNIQVGNGTATAPTYAFANDTNTGIYRPNADTLGLVTNGVERMTINATGDITIAGNLTVTGGTTTLNTQSVLIEDNILVLNKNLTGTPPTTLVSGIEIERGTQTNYQFVFEEATDLFKVGMSNALQAVATRKDTVTANTIPYWNATANLYDFTNTITMTPSTGTISATTFSGNATNATNAVNATNATNATHATNAANVAITNFSTSGTNYLLFSGGTSGNNPVRIRSTQFTCNPSTGMVGIGTTPSSVYKLHVEGQIYSSDDITAFSDARKKADLQVITQPLDRIQKLTGYTFTRTDKLARRYTGLLAQDVEKILPEAVYAAPEENGQDQLSVAYGNMMGLIVEGIKDIVARLEKLEARYRE